MKEPAAKYEGSSRVALLTLAVLGAVGVLAWFYFSATQRPEVAFLSPEAGTEWMVYPAGPDLTAHKCLEMSSVFRRSFTCAKAPASTSLAIRAWRHYALSVNGTPVNRPDSAGTHWKKTARFEIASLLRAGTNYLEVTVTNTNGPPALALALIADGIRLASDTQWQVSLAGAAWRPAKFASAPPLSLPGSPGFDGERTWTSLKARWPFLAGFAVLALFGYGFIVLAARGKFARFAAQEWIPPAFAAVVWIALFANNVPQLPDLIGYDVGGHLNYVRYLQEHRALPSASEGWEMYQPPLYYLICAGLLDILGFPAFSHEGIVTLRWLGLVLGLAHLAVLWGALKLLFPGERGRPLWALAVAALLPPLLYLSHYVTNEPLAAALATATLYQTLRLLRRENISLRAWAGLGFCMGAALLAKASAVLLLPPIVGALFFRFRQEGLPPFRSRSMFFGAATALAISAVICGGHYGRMWIQYGNPLTGNWDPKVAIPWWQDNGYQSWGYFLRFGVSLTYPWFSGLHGFADGVYSTLWGDGQCGAVHVLQGRAPWNYDLMAIGYWVALVPTCAFCLGCLLMLRRFLKKPSPEAFLLLGMIFCIGGALFFMALKVPSFAQAKAFYGLGGLLPFCALAAIGLDALTRLPVGRKVLRPVMVCLFGVWALTTLASFWISASAGRAGIARVWYSPGEQWLPGAVEVLKHNVEKHPDQSWIRTCFAQALLQNGDYQAAAQEAAKIPGGDSSYANAQLVLSDIRHNAGQLAEAIDHAQNAVASAPGNGVAYAALAKLLVTAGRNTEAETIARNGLAVAPFSASLHMLLACSQLEDSPDAGANYQRELALALQPQWPEGHRLLGSALVARNHFDAALAEYSQAYVLAPQDSRIQKELAGLYFHQGNMDDAAGLYSSAVLLRPNDAECWYQFAGVLAAQKHFDDARIKAEKARALAEAAGLAELIKKSDELLARLRAAKPD